MMARSICYEKKATRADGKTLTGSFEYIIMINIFAGVVAGVRRKDI